MRDVRKAGLLVTILLLVFFSHGHLVRLAWTPMSWLWKLERNVPHLLFEAILFFTVFVLAVTVCYRIAKKPEYVAAATRLLNRIGVFLVVIPGLMIAYHCLAQNTSQVADPRLEPQSPTDRGSASLPDIYYIILDGYPRGDIQREVFNLDSTSFTRQLEQMGFYVARKSRANYPQTYLSLASSLNLTYLDGGSGKDEGRRKGWASVVAMIHNNRVAQFLRQQGYVYVTFASGYSGTEIRNADVYVRPGRVITEYQNLYIEMTPLRFVDGLLRRQSLHDLRRDLVLFTFEEIPNIAKLNSQTFVFAHLLVPHPPFRFGENGEWLNVESREMWMGSRRSEKKRREFIRGMARKRSSSRKWPSLWSGRSRRIHRNRP